MSGKWVKCARGEAISPPAIRASTLDWEGLPPSTVLKFSGPMACSNDSPEVPAIDLSLYWRAVAAHCPQGSLAQSKSDRQGSGDGRDCQGWLCRSRGSPEFRPRRLQW